MEKLLLLNKILVFTSSGILFISIIFNLLTFNPTKLIQKISFILFSLVILFSQLENKRVLKEFPYMKDNFGKSIFIFIISTLYIDSKNNIIFGIILLWISIALFILHNIFKKKNNIEYNK